MKINKIKPVQQINNGMCFTKQELLKRRNELEKDKNENNNDENNKFKIMFEESLRKLK